MSMIVTRARRVAQPPTSWRVAPDWRDRIVFADPGSSLSVYAPDGVQRVGEYVTNSLETWNPAAVTTDPRFGRVLNLTHDYFDSSLNFPDSSGFTALAWVRRKDVGGGDRLVLSRGRDGYGNGWSFGLQGGLAPKARVVLTTNGVAAYTATSATAMPNDEWHSIGMSWDGVTLRVYVDGIVTGSTIPGNSVLRSSTRGIGSIWSASEDNTSYWYGLRGPAVVVRDAMRENDVLSWHDNPWQIFAPTRRVVHFAAAGGVYDVALSESASASDSLGAAGALTSALAEAASAADVVSAAAAFAAAMSEVATATDGTAAVSVVLGALTEGGTGVDTLTSTISGAGVYDVALLESATTADAETAGGVFYVSVSEQGVGSEALSTGGVFYVTLADSGTGTDVLSGHLPTSFSAALSESVSALDVMVSTIPSAGTLWTAMDTAAASGWTAVATTNTWTIVPTT